MGLGDGVKFQNHRRLPRVAQVILLHKKPIECPLTLPLQRTDSSRQGSHRCCGEALPAPCICSPLRSHQTILFRSVSKALHAAATHPEAGCVLQGGICRIKFSTPTASANRYGMADDAQEKCYDRSDSAKPGPLHAGDQCG
jgi:hypothetical protein